MDPLSITTGCITLIQTLGKTVLTVTKFVRECRDARADLTAVTREISELQMVLELLKDDVSVSDKSIIPESLQSQILSIIGNCASVVLKINATLENNEGKTGAVKWVAVKKSEVVGLRMSLEAHRTSLNLALELVSISVAKTTKEDTTVIRGDVAEIKQDTSQIPQIMEELTRLRALVANGENHVATAGQGYVLERYLDGLTSYAETIAGDVVWSDEDEDIRVPSERTSPEPQELYEGEVEAQEKAPTDPSPQKIAPIRALRPARHQVPVNRDPPSGVRTPAEIISQRLEGETRRKEEQEETAQEHQESLGAQNDQSENISKQSSAGSQGDESTKGSTTNKTDQNEPKLALLPSSLPIAPTRSSRAPIRRKLVVVGDGACGKTALLVRWAKGVMIQVNVPTVFENYVVSTEVDNQLVDLSLWDTAGMEDFDRLRPLSFVDTHVYLVSFSIASPDSAENVVEKWMPHLAPFYQGIPILLVGLKKDLRHDPVTLRELARTNQSPVTTEQGEKLRREIGAYKYLECSSLTAEGVAEVLEEATRLSLLLEPPRQKKESSLFRRFFRRSYQ